MASPVEPIPEDRNKNRGMFSSSWADPYFSYLKIGTDNSITGIFRGGMCGAFFFSFSVECTWWVCITVLLPLPIMGKGGSGQNVGRLCECVCVHVPACMSPAPGDLDGLPNIEKVQRQEQRPAFNFCLCGSCPPHPWWRRSNEINPQTLGSSHRTETSVCPSKRYTLAKCTLLSEWPDAPRRIPCITLVCTCSAVLVT